MEHKSEGCEPMKAYLLMPTVDLCGNAGNMGPGEKEQRYRPFAEIQRLKAGGKEAQD